MTHEELALLHGYLDGTLDEASFDRLQSLLRESADARRTLRTLSTVETKLQQLAAVSPASIRLLALPPVPERRFFRWVSRRPAAAGLIAGLLGASAAWASALPWLGEVRQTVKTVFSESFESGVAKTAPGLPRESTQWSGDEADVVRAEQEVEPRSGARMLRFRSATYPGENSPRSQWGDVYRIVDVSGLASEGRTVARVSASFAQGVVTGEERFACRVGAYALDQDLSTLPSTLSHTWLQQNNSATGSRRAVLTGTDRWQEVSVELPITRETRFVVLHLAVVQEQPTLKSGVVQFPGHFMDDVKVELITRP